MPHERTITVGINGKFFNIPTVVNGSQLSNDQAVEHAIANKLLSVGFATQGEAVKAAQKRSRSFDKKRKR